MIPFPASKHRVLLATVLFGAGAALGCGNGRPASSSSPSTTSATFSEDDDVAAGLLEHHRHHHHGGVTLFIAMSLDTLGVSPEQRAAVEKIRKDLHTRMEPGTRAEQGLTAILADGLVAGTFDQAKVDAAVAQVTAAASAVHDASVDALNELHAVLTPPERAALVDKVEAHWAVWQKANSEESGATTSDGSRLTILAKDLDLAPEQVERIRAALGEGMKGAPRIDAQEIAAHVRGFGDAFRGEKFDAKTLSTAGPANAHLAGWGAAHMARFVELAGPVLTPEQRAKLASRLREHAGHDPSAETNQ
jgi:Spy/CpxP family protein refolding chaperone